MTSGAIAAYGVILLVLLPIGGYIALEGMKTLHVTWRQRDTKFFTGLAMFLIGIGLWVVFTYQLINRAMLCYGG